MDASPRQLGKIRRLDPSKVPEGMDPSTTYKLKFRIISRCPRPEVPGPYIATEYVDADITNYKDFMDDLYNKYPWGLNEVFNLTYFDPTKKCYAAINCDQDMMAMFATFSEPKYIELNCWYSPKNDEPVPNPFSNLSIPVVPATPSLQDPSQAGPSENTSSDPKKTVLVDHSYLANPFPMFEHVGVNEEGFYGQDVPAVDESESSEEESNEDSDEHSDEKSDDDSQEESDDGIGEEAYANQQQIEAEFIAQDARPSDIPQVAYDKDDPPMTVGSIYPNIEEFRIALAQASIKHEFEYNVEKTDPERLRAYCAAKDKGCKWRIHASALQDHVTIEVKVNSHEHNCGSKQRSKKMKNATKKWIADKVLDWVREDATLGAKELQRRIQEKYHIEINYKRVHAGKQLALDRVYGKWEDSFDSLYSFKAEVEKRSPGSVVIIEHYSVGEKQILAELAAKRKAEVAAKRRLAKANALLAIEGETSTGKKRKRNSKKSESTTLPNSATGSNSLEEAQLSLAIVPTAPSTTIDESVTQPKGMTGNEKGKGTGGKKNEKKKTAKKDNKSKEKLLAENMSTPTKKKSIPLVDPDSPAMRTRSKLNL